MNLFGTSKRKAQAAPARTHTAASSTAESIQRLNEALDNLEKREKHVMKRVDKEQSEAKRLIAAKNKNGAMMALKRKKMYEGQLSKINGTRMTIENQKMALETANFNQEVMKAMSQGAQALQSVNDNMTIDKVDETMDNIQEQMDVANEISEAISQPTGMGYEDEDELEAELAELEAEDLDETLLSVENTPATVTVNTNPEPAISGDQFPAAPNQEVALSEEEEELRALEASMALPS